MSNEINWPAWIRSWPCIEKNCDGKGTVCHGVYHHDDGDTEFDISQCQFCDEREKLARHVERLEEKDAEPKDAAFNAFMAGLGPSPWAR